MKKVGDQRQFYKQIENIKQISKKKNLRNLNLLSLDKQRSQKFSDFKDNFQRATSGSNHLNCNVRIESSSRSNHLTYNFQIESLKIVYFLNFTSTWLMKPHYSDILELNESTSLNQVNSVENIFENHDTYDKQDNFLKQFEELLNSQNDTIQFDRKQINIKQSQSCSCYECTNNILKNSKSNNNDILSDSQKRKTMEDIENLMLFYLEGEEIDKEQLNSYFERVEKKQEEFIKNNDLYQLDLLQKRIQVLVFQSPLAEISSTFRTLLLPHYQENPQMSYSIVNDDFPPLLPVFTRKSDIDEDEQTTASILQRDYSYNLDCSTCESLPSKTSKHFIELGSKNLLSLVDEKSEDSKRILTFKFDSANEFHGQFNQKKEINIQQGNSQFVDVLVRIFNTFNGRIPSVLRVMLFSPEYLGSFWGCFEKVFIDASAWDQECLFEMAMMTASEYENEYVLGLFNQLFQQSRGSNPLQSRVESSEKVNKAWQLISMLKNRHYLEILNGRTSSDTFQYLLCDSPSWNQNELLFSMLAISLTEQLVAISKALSLIPEEFISTNFSLHQWKQDRRNLRTNVSSRKHGIRDSKEVKRTIRVKTRLRLKECDWKTQTFEFIASRNRGIAETLQTKHECLSSLANKNLISFENSHSFTSAVSQYCLVTMMGQIQEKYTYSHVNHLLDEQYRHFLRLLITQPHSLAPNQVLSLNCHIQDLMHIIALTSETKFFTLINFICNSLAHFLK